MIIKKNLQKVWVSPPAGHQSSWCHCEIAVKLVPRQGILNEPKKKKLKGTVIESILSAGSTHLSTLELIGWSFIQVTTDGGRGAKKWNVKNEFLTLKFLFKKMDPQQVFLFPVHFHGDGPGHMTTPMSLSHPADSACCLQQQQRQLVAHSNRPAGDSHLLLQLPWQPATTVASSQWGGTDIFISFYGGGGKGWRGGAHCHVFT